jgi:hypothetical protein
VLSGDVHAGQSRAATHRRRGTVAGGVAIRAVGSDSSRLLAPGGRDSLSTGLDRAKSWEGLLGRGVKGRLLRRRSIVGLLLASSLLAQRRIGRLGGRGCGMGEVFLIRNVLDSDVVVVLLHQLLCWGKSLRGRAGGCFGRHFQCRPFRVDQRVLRRRWVEGVRPAKPVWEVL